MNRSPVWADYALHTDRPSWQLVERWPPGCGVCGSFRDCSAVAAFCRTDDSIPPVLWIDLLSCCETATAIFFWGSDDTSANRI